MGQQHTNAAAGEGGLEELRLDRPIPRAAFDGGSKGHTGSRVHEKMPCLMDSIRLRTSCLSSASPELRRSIGSRPPKYSCGVLSQRSGSSTTSAISWRSMRSLISAGSETKFCIAIYLRVSEVDANCSSEGAAAH